MAYKNDKLIVAAIDFGITLSGFAYSLVHDYMKDPLKISMYTWVADLQNLISLKTPTCVLLSPKQEFEAFGYEAEELYSCMAEEETHHDHYFFEGFIMLLYRSESTQKLSKNSLIKDVKGKEVPALDVFAHVIRYLKNHLLMDLYSKGIPVNNKDIHWVLPVPAMWDNSAKQFMREAADKAGIPTEQLTICLDSEAPFLYCQKLDKNMMNFPDTHSLPSFRAGTKYMIIDLGCQTTEITIYLKKSDGTLEELHRPTGGMWGGTKVNEAFERMMIEIVGSKIFEKFKNDEKYSYNDLFRNFKIQMRIVTPNYSDKICIKIPCALAYMFKEGTGGKKEMEAIYQTPYANKMTWRADKLRMDADLFEDLFTELVDMLVEHLEKLMTKDNLSDISTFLMVGEFSEFPVMHNAIKKAFLNKKVIVPADAGLAVLKGAVLFGHESGAVPQSIPPGLL